MKKIMFNDKYGLTQAVLDGRKTMTRRIFEMDKRPCQEKNCIYCRYYYREFGCKWINDRASYKYGELVAVAQSYHSLNKKGFVAPEWCCHSCEESAGYENKMFVRANLMPYRIRITGIKVEHLQDISEEDCLREGVEKWMDCYIVTGIMERGGKNNMCFDTPRLAFAALIDRISGKGTWERNPWVMAYEFELCI